MKNPKTKRQIKIAVISVIIAIILQLCTPIFNYATTSEVQINISNTSITVDGKEISTNSSSNVYKTTNIEKNDDVTTTVQNTVINITTAGTYRISGTAENTQIAVNASNSDEVNLILDNANITCTTAPAIIIYNALDNKKAGEAGVTITVADNTTNTIKGSHIPKNATYTVNGETKQYSKKYDGAISSEVSLILDGNGSLTVESDKEGIETKLHLTVNGGNYVINSCDDAINASEDSVSVITINNGTIYANIKAEAEEGDGIDSNGYIYINGGNVYAFASATSPDSGLDSDLGIYINGGTVISTGNMVDEVSEDSTQKFIFLQFTNKITDGTLVTITDESGNPIMAYETDKDYQTFLYSSSSLNTDSYKVYTGGSIEGTQTHGLYNNITSYTKGTEASYTEANKSAGMMRGGMQEQFNESNINSQSTSNNSYGGIALLAVGTILVIVVIIILKKSNKQ